MCVVAAVSVCRPAHGSSLSRFSGDMYGYVFRAPGAGENDVWDKTGRVGSGMLVRASGPEKKEEGGRTVSGN
jgi:hypothetical protein